MGKRVQQDSKNFNGQNEFAMDKFERYVEVKVNERRKDISQKRADKQSCQWGM